MDKKDTIYNAYFSEADADRPYDSDSEFLSDILCYVDLLLNIAAYERNEFNERLDLRGVVITPQEYQRALRDRQVGMYTEEVREYRRKAAVELKKAGRHIRSRAADRSLCVPCLLDRAKLDSTEILCFFLALAVELDRKYEVIYGYLQDNVSCKMPTVGLGLSLAGYVRDKEEKRKTAFRGERILNHGRSPLWQYFLEDTGSAQNVVQTASRLSEPMILKQSVCDCVHGFITLDAFWEDAEKSIVNIAFLVKASFTWDDIVLRDEAKQQLRNLCNRCKYQEFVMNKWNFKSRVQYGFAPSALFYGPPGTGKTMAAGIIAHELDLPLYRVNLSRVVSKYIGETEKNLDELFVRAAEKKIVLFFDEADSLFAKRTGVNNSNDRYANMGTGYLLQRIEDYPGIVIMATNNRDNIDPAFTRRIQFFISFYDPGEEQRYELWQKAFPKEAQIEEDLPIRWYAENFPLKGSGIRDVSLAAAYLAAAEGRGIREKDIEDAVKPYAANEGWSVPKTQC